MGFSEKAGRRLALGLGCAMASTMWTVHPVHAQFADCAAPGYLSGVDDRMASTGLACDEAVRFTIETPGGTRQVRIVYSTADLAPGLLRGVGDIRDGVERAAAALRSIGQGTTADITIWASDLAAPEDELGRTDAVARPIDAAGSECVIAMYRGSDTPFVIAHEFFHCVQYATVGEKTHRASSSWWAEGSAEWFANFTVPGRAHSDGDVGAFDSVSPNTPLTSMAQEAVVFFFWLSKTFGPSMVMAVMEAMPDAGEAAQQDALAGLLSDQDLREFAEDYLDRLIAQPDGRIIPSNPMEGDIYVWDDSTEHDLEADRFVLGRFQLEFACGDWSIERREEEGVWRVSLDEDPWEDLPERLSISGPDPDTYRVAAFGTDPQGFRVTIEATRNPCLQCETTPVDDEALSCLVGRWQLASGGYGEQIERALRASGQFESIEYPNLESELVISRDGTFEFPGPPEGYNAEVRTPGGDLVVGFGTLAMASNGQWSVDGDTLHMCQNPHRAEIDLTIVNPDGDSGRLRTGGGPPGAVQRSRDFTCGGGGLTLIEDGGFVTWHYTRAD